MRVTTIPAPIRPRAVPLSSVGKLQSYLRRLLRCSDLWIDTSKRGSSPQLRIGHEVVGTIAEAHEEGERYWAVTLIVLEEDLALTRNADAGAELDAESHS